MFQSLGQLDRAGLVLLCYGEQNGGLCALRRNTQARALCSDTHLANICQCDGLTVVGQFDYTAGDLVGIFGCQHTTHDKLIAILIENATRRVERHILRRGQHLVHRNAQQAQLFGRQQHLILLDVATDYGHLSYATRREQSRTNGPFGNRAQLFERGFVRCKTYDHHLAQDRRLRAERRLTNICRQCVRNGRELLGYNLAGTIDVCIPIKFDPYDRETCR